MSKIKQKDYQELYELYTENHYCQGNITKVTQFFCKLYSITFTDTERRRVSKILKKGSITTSIVEVDNVIETKTIDVVIEPFFKILLTRLLSVSVKGILYNLQKE